MIFATFEELQIQIQLLYQGSEYQAALDLATQHLNSFPEQAHLLAYWRAAAAARSGQAELAISMLDEMAAAGFWYSPNILRKSPAFKSLQGQLAFEELVVLNEQLQEAERRQLFPLITLRSEGRCQSGTEACPLLIGLHANASTALASVDFWRAAARAGWLTAVPQSTQGVWKNAYLWDDQETTARDIRKHYHTLMEQYAVDASRTVLAGYAGGGEIAAWLALSAVIPVQGFIAINPTGPMTEELSQWQRFLEANPLPGLRGYLIWGVSDDSIPLENLPELAQLLNHAGIETDYEEIPAAGHDFQPEFEESLMRGLNFIDRV